MDAADKPTGMYSRRVLQDLLFARQRLLLLSTQLSQTPEKYASN
jgi:hypothetical protein